MIRPGFRCGAVRKRCGPRVDEQRRRSLAHIRDRFEYGVVLPRYRSRAVVVATRLGTQPFRRSAAATPFRCDGIEFALRDIRVSGRGDFGFAEECGQRGQRGVERVVAAAGDCGSAGVDKFPVRIPDRWGDLRVGVGDVSAIAVAERILDVALVRGILHRGEVIRAVTATVRE